VGSSATKGICRRGGGDFRSHGRGSLSGTVKHRRERGRQGRHFLLSKRSLSPGTRLGRDPQEYSLLSGIQSKERWGKGKSIQGGWRGGNLIEVGDWGLWAGRLTNTWTKKIYEKVLEIQTRGKKKKERGWCGGGGWTNQYKKEILNGDVQHPVISAKSVFSSVKGNEN